MTVEQEDLRALAASAKLYRLVADEDNEALGIIVEGWGEPESQYTFWVTRGSSPHELEVLARLRRVGDPLLAGEAVTVVPA